jgi:N-acetylglucosaminyldiphosphoundecaprenol N-acetyl-beta-D-mannosaminyltransferase
MTRTSDTSVTAVDERVVVGGVPVLPLSRPEWSARLLRDWRAVRETGAGPKFHTTANGNVLSLYARTPAYRAALTKADAIAADGMSILWGARVFARRTIPERCSTTDLFHDIVRTAEEHGLSIFMFGATEEMNDRAVQRVRELYPRLKIAGRRHGYFKDEEEDRIVEEIVATKPDIVWVGLGVPRQEIFVARHLEKFQGVTWVKTCGGLYDFLAGLRSRAPAWMRRNGLEWAYRTILEPRRLFWRYATTNVHAIYRMAVASGPRGAGA